MLLSAQQRQEEGVRVAIGYLETHGRVETTAVAAGMPRVPRRKVKYRDVELEEMDLDAILETKPALVLVDELAALERRRRPPPRSAGRMSSKSSMPGSTSLPR